MHSVIKMVSKQVKTQKSKEWKKYSVDIALEGTTATYSNGTLTVTGPKGSIQKILRYPNVRVEVKDGKVHISTPKFSRNEKKIIHTYQAHVVNMVKGSKEGFEYKLQVVFAKFPITVEKVGNTIVVKNLLGEKVPRRLNLLSDVNVEVKGKEIVVTGIDKEKVGQVAGSIEQLTRITHLDRRVIQDGIYITEKPHKRYI